MYCGTTFMYLLAVHIFSSVKAVRAFICWKMCDSKIVIELSFVINAYIDFWQLWSKNVDIFIHL